MQRKILVTLAGLLAMTALVAIVSCSSAPTPVPAATAPTQAPQPALTQPTAAPQPTQAVKLTTASTAPTAAPTAAPKAGPPTAVLKIVPVAATKDDPNAITATLGATTTIYLGSSGLPNTSVGYPVHLAASVADPKNPASKFAWTLTVPVGSKSALVNAAAATTEFTPDVVGVYKVDVVASNDAGSGPMASIQIHADKYEGVTAGNCQQCHPDKVSQWAKTAHASIFTQQIDGGADPATSHYSETCLECHTTGYDPGTNNAGFADVQAQTGWKFPSLAQIQSGKGNWDAVPAALKNVANIQCEDCHGPAQQHVTQGVNTMAVSLSEGVCDTCHAVGPHHTKGIELKSAAHADATAQAWTYPTGPSHQECVRCHSGAGYISFLENPKDQASWDNTPQTVTCAVCHDPHSDANSHQLRIVGKPVGLPFDAKDVGLSATCEECHNSRQTAADALKGQFPHYSSAAEFLNATGGVTYGQKISDSPHGTIVGAAPIPDPTDKTGKTMLFGGDVPGPCVTCHMWPTITDAKDANAFKVGGHSFNMVSPDGKTDYTAACQSCHGAIKTFDIPAKADYDGNGKVEGVQDEVKGLLDVLAKALADKGVKKVDSGYPYFQLPANASDSIKNAVYNFRTVYGTMWSANDPGDQGKAQAIHNFNRSVMLLQLSYKDLTGQDVPGATLMK